MRPNPKIAVVINPRSAAGRTGRRWRGIQSRLERRLGPVAARFTDSPGAGIGLTRELLRQGFDLIVAAGGDGTANEVANGFLELDRPINPEACLGILPLGTGGDFRRTLGVPASPGSAIETLAEGQPRAIDVGKVTFVGHHGGSLTRYFVNLLSFGMGGEVAARAKNPARILGGRAAFLWATIKSFTLYRGKEIRLTLDGKEEMPTFVTDVAVGNGRFYGGGMDPCPYALLDDGILEVTVIDYMNCFQFIREIPPLYSGNIYRRPKGHHFRARQLHAEAEDEVKVEIDGEPLGRLPLDVTLLPAALKVMAPGEARS
jgi:YegS/Rv2252/BmrU family lipid kinase